MSEGRVYVRVESGLVYETVPPIFREDGTYVPIEERTVPDLLPYLIDITEISPQPEAWWTYDGEVFYPPELHVPTQAEILAANTDLQTWLLSQASQSMAPILVSLQLGDATDEETTAAKAWQAYYRVLKAVDVTKANPQWPVAPDGN